MTGTPSSKTSRSRSRSSPSARASSIMLMHGDDGLAELLDLQHQVEAAIEGRGV